MAEQNKETLEKKCPWNGIISRDVIKYGQIYGIQGEKCFKCIGHDKHCHIYRSLDQIKYRLN